MNMFKTKRQKNMTTGLFVVYIILLVWLILFKFQIDLSHMDHLRSVNLIPYGASMVVNGQLSLDEIIYNMLVFVPMGIYISMLRPGWSFLQKGMPALLGSLLLETLQYVFAIGASDITDVIGNTLGGLLGIGIYMVFQRMLKDKTNPVINILAFIATMLAVVLLAVVIIVN